MSTSKTTTDRETIRKWAEERGGRPAAVRSTHGSGEGGTGIIRIEFPDAPNARDDNLEEISWEEFFEKFEESKLALAEYHPFWSVDAVPQTTAMLFVVAEKDQKVNNDAHAVAASKALKGPNGVTVVQGANHAMTTPGAFETAADAAAAWFQKYL